MMVNCDDDIVYVHDNNVHVHDDNVQHIPSPEDQLLQFVYDEYVSLHSPSPSSHEEHPLVSPLNPLPIELQNV